MLIEKLGFDDVRYNPELSAFEASVQIWEKGHVYSYPVHMLAPLHAEFGLIARGLTERALRAHRHAPARGIRLRRTPVPGELPKTLERSELRRPGTAIAA